MNYDMVVRRMYSQKVGKECSKLFGTPQVLFSDSARDEADFGVKWDKFISSPGRIEKLDFSSGSDELRVVPRGS